jgi:NTP pyrophosphatase (non-canonical NTP hydrolase)
VHDLTFDEVTSINTTRCSTWHAGFPNDEGWLLSDWSNALAGEVGEACNIIKKIRRAQINTKGASDPNLDNLKQALADELGDVFLYLDLLATKAGIDLQQAIVDKFNAVSKREGFPHTLRTTDDSNHYVKISDDDWVIQHPLVCRRQGSLFDCIYTKKGNAHFNSKYYPNGVYILALEPQTFLPVVTKVDGT